MGKNGKQWGPKTAKADAWHGQGGQYGGSQHGSWRYWRGIDSPRAPWRKENPRPAFPTFMQMPSQPETSKTEEATMEVGGLQTLQSVLTKARRAELRVKKLGQEREGLQRKWEKFNEELKATFVKEKNKFHREVERNEKEMEAALQGQEVARQTVVQVAIGQPVVTDSRKTDEAATANWEAMTQQWEREGDDMDGVLQRALGGTAHTPPQSRARRPRSPLLDGSSPRGAEAANSRGAVPMETENLATYNQMSPGFVRNDPYMTSPGASSVAGPLAAARATTTEFPSNHAPPPGLPPQEGGEIGSTMPPGTPPRVAPASIATPPKTDRPASVGAPPLAEMLSAKRVERRSALEPFGGKQARDAGHVRPPDPQAGERTSGAFVDDDNDELDRGASNMCIGDAGAQALFTCFGHHDTEVPSALTALRSILDFSGAKPLLGVLIFLVFLRELCRALKNHIGSSGVVACNVFDVSPATYDISSICWILPWKIMLQRLVAHPLVTTLHSTILQRPNPCVVFWRCACLLCLVGNASPVRAAAPSLRALARTLVKIGLLNVHNHQDETELEEPPSHLELVEGEWVPGALLNSQYHAHRALISARSWGINLRHVQDINDVMDALLRQGSELFDEGPASDQEPMHLEDGDAITVLTQDLSELTLCSSGDFPDLDMMGEPCTAIIAATNLPPGSATEAGAAERLDVFTFLDFRPIGYKPHVHFSHSFQLHVPTLLHLYGICVAPDFGLSIDGDTVVPTSAQLAAPTEPSSGDPTLSSGDALLNQTRQERSRSRGRSPTHSSGNHLARKCPQAVQQWQHRDKQLSCPCPVQPLHVQLSRMPPVYSVPALPEFVDLHIACKITDPPDLTVRLDGAIHMTHEEHLRALFLPFGVGNPVHGAPPEVMMQEQEQEGPRDFAQALFLILTPHFTPDIIVIPLAVPSSVPEVFSELEEVREADRARRFTWLTPAQPQLADAFGTIVAVPEWTEEVVAVFDLRTIANTTFAACVPHHATREELLAISGLGAQYPADVYVHIQQDALLPGQQVALWTGVTIAMADPGEALTVGRPLEEMLQSSEGWDPAVEVPGQDDPAFLLLTDEGHARFPLHEARRAQTRTDIADLLGYDMPRMTLRGVLPRPLDVCVYGWKCNALVVATQRLPRPACRDTDPKVVAYDLRAILQGLFWETVDAAYIPIRDLIARFGAHCPLGYHVHLTGGRIDWVAGQEVMYLQVAQRIAIAFDPDGDPDPSESGSDMDHQPSSDAEAPTDDSSSSTSSRPARSRSPRGRANRHPSVSEPEAVDDLADLHFLKPSPAIRTPNRRGYPAILCGSAPQYAVWGEPGAFYAQFSSVWAPLVSCKVLAEPTPGSAQEAQQLAVLRFLAPRLGRPWRYRPPPDAIFIRDDPSDDEEDSDEDEVLLLLTFSILTPGYVPENVAVSLQLPKTAEAALRRVEAARCPDRARLFPCLLPARPQPLPGAGTLVSVPLCLGDITPPKALVCIDTTRFDGRLFATTVPTYVNPQFLCCLAEIPDHDRVQIVTGEASNFLAPDSWCHVSDGDAFIFLPPGGVLGPARQLEQALSQRSAWNAHPVLPAPSSDSIYCLISEDGCVRAHLDLSRPTTCRAQLAGALGVTARQLTLTPAVPPTRDAALDGFPCRTAIIAHHTDPPMSEVPLRVIFDLRAMLRGWHFHQILHEELECEPALEELLPYAPTGWAPFFPHFPADAARIRVIPGQVIIVGLRPQALAPASQGSASPTDPVLASLPEVSEAVDEAQIATSPGPTVTPGQAHTVEGQAGGQTLGPTQTGSGFPVVVQGYARPNLGAVLQSFTGVFLVLGQNYQPETVSVRLRVGCSVADALDTLHSRRRAQAAACLPRLIVVHPQPRGDHALVIGMPSWPCDGAMIAYDCREIDGRLFSLCIGSRASKTDLLIAAGLDEDLDCSIYVKDQPWALEHDAVTALAHGDLIQVTP
ncbi:unnamed protein product, partial [Symbiodinium microadriaticum]